MEREGSKGRGKDKNKGIETDREGRGREGEEERPRSGGDWIRWNENEGSGRVSNMRE